MVVRIIRQHISIYWCYTRLIRDSFSFHHSCTSWMHPFIILPRIFASHPSHASRGSRVLQSGDAGNVRCPRCGGAPRREVGSPVKRASALPVDPTDVYLTHGGGRKLVGYPNFSRSVFGCIEADSWNERHSLQNFRDLKDWQALKFCTAPNSKIYSFSASLHCTVSLKGH